MNKVIIRNLSIYEMIQFVKQAKNVQGDITVTCGRYIVDGKSLMGLMSIGILKDCEVEYPEKAFEFAEFLSKYER